MRNEWNAHSDIWNNCTKCDLHRHTTRHVLARGFLPCDYLFVGEAPGGVEDISGFPFVGPSGLKLDWLLQESKISSFAITNIVACTPWTDENRNALREPSRKESNCCHSRMVDFMELARPRAVILLGTVAQTMYMDDPLFSKLPVLHLKHPSYFIKIAKEKLESKQREFIYRLTTFAKENHSG